MPDAIATAGALFYRRAMRRALLVLAVVASALASGCPKKAPAAVDAGGSPAAERSAPDGDVVPVFDARAPVDPRAASLCAALHGLPAARRGTCCGKGPEKSPVEASCAGLLSDALRGGALALDEPAREACVAAREAQLSGCAWVSALPPQPPDACRGVIRGSSQAGARCRSSLECGEGLRCHGAGPLDPGRCGPPAADGAPCGASVDALSSVVGQAVIDRAHPECRGVCLLGRCRAAAPVGGACAADVECGADARCDDGRCAKGRIPVDGPCARGGCVEGARCRDGRCRALAAEGGACGDDFDCAVGGCVKPPGASSGVCGMKCGSLGG